MPDTSRLLSRRHLLRHSYCGFGLMGLAGLLAERGLAVEPADPMAPKPPHFAPRAKRVIFMFMHGGPSHLDTFDPKPLLTRDHGKPLPFKRPLTFAEGDTGSLLKSPWQFRQYGESGIPVSELFPNVARMSTSCASCAPWWAIAWRMAAPSCSCTPGRTRSRVPAWVRGRSTGWARRTGICPPS